MKRIFLSITVAALLSACSTTVYVPNTVNVPLLKEEKEVKFNLDQNNLQLAVAVTDHIGIMANGFYRGHTADNNYRHRGGLAEVGAGYFHNFNNQVVVETFAGIGLGNVYKQETFKDSTNTAYLAQFRANATRFFIQPGIGYSHRFFDLAFTPRFSFVKYANFSSENYREQDLKRDFLDNGQLTRSMYVFAEPAITVRVGYKFVKLQAQYGVTLNLGGQNIRYDKEFSSIGLVIDIAKWYDQ